MKTNEDCQRLDAQRCRAAQYFCANYSREQRYLIILSRDCERYLQSEEYLRTKDTANQCYFDFLIFFEELKAKMNEFRWSGDYLKENGIDFKALRKLYFAVA